MKILRKQKLLRKALSLWLLTVLVFGELTGSFLLFPNIAEAAEVQIDTQASAAQAEHTQSGVNTVFISDQVGYKFYVEANGVCVFKKTTDGGDSWGSQTTFDSNTACASPSVWYEPWTPDDTGDYIHITTIDQATGDENMNYNRLDTTDDSLLMGSNPVNISTSTVSSGLTLGSGANKNTVTKGTDGTVYAALNDGGGSHVVECSSNCNLENSWSEVGTTPMDNQNSDWPLLVPLLDGDIMLIVRDINTDDTEYQIWNNSAWSGTWSAIDSDAGENRTYDVGMSAVTHPETGDVYLAYTADANTLGNNNDIRTAKYDADADSWSSTEDILTDETRGVLQVAMGIDANLGTVYVAYSVQATAGSNNTADVYWATSTEAMTTWSSEQGPVNSSQGNIYGIDVNYYSDERIYVTWYEDGSRDVFGDTLADIAPDVVVTATSSQISEVRASTSDVYVGGAFVITENNSASRNVTSIKITEAGTIDGANGIGDIALYYDMSTSSPYDCSEDSYEGNEPQFGVTDTNGFSGANGTAQFTDVVAIATSSTMCVYVVVDILKAADDDTTLDIEITNPATDVVVADATPIPTTVTSITASTSIADDDLTLTHYHWRDDTGDETDTGANSVTGGNEDTAIAALQTEVPRRLRIGLSNEGSTTTLPTALRLEYGLAAPTCNDVSAWTDVNATDDDWNMFDSSNLTEGANTTDVAVANGGVSDENTFFLSSNGGVRDTTSQTGDLNIDFDEYTALEYSMVASTTATEGNTYCFRVTDEGEPISSYDVVPQVTISADVRVRATGTQATSVDIPTDNFYIGGAFTITENVSSRNLSSITITENGTVDGTAGVEDIRIYYDLDTSDPYNCVSESYAGNELQYGATSSAFSSANGTSTFTQSLAISTTSTMCAYVVMDVTGDAQNGETIDVTINSATTDVTVSGGGSVAPSTPLDITGSTTLNGAILTQFGYHWRQDNGSEVTASSSVGGENTAQTEFPVNQAVRLRLGVDNEGATTSVPTRYSLEYGVKINTCESISVWTNVDEVGDAWDLFDSSNLTDAADTTNVSTSTQGGVTDPSGQSFLGTNGGVRDTSSSTGNISLSETQFTELEFSLTSTATTSYETDYCFRLVGNGSELPQYTNYAELTTAAKRDFKVQRGTETIGGLSVTLTAGADYDAPASTTAAFVRITNVHHTGAGRSVADNGQEADQTTVYISDASDLTSSFTLSRDDTNQDTVVSWEIVEFIGEIGTDNEIIVREQSSVTLSNGSSIATGTAVSNIADDSDVVVFITGSSNDNTGTGAYYAGQVTSAWATGSDEPVFTRVGNNANVDISYAIVEFTGLNWRIQRAEHTYTDADTVETEPISAVNSLSRTFLHTQKRVGAASQQANFGHEVWLSGIGQVSFKLSLNAATTSIEHVSVAWVVENTQTSEGAMKVQQRSGSITGGVEPRTTTLSVGDPVDAVNNTSLFVMSAFEQNSNNYPRVLGGVTLVSTTSYEIYNSDRVSNTPWYYRTEVVEWPVTGLSIRQNYYRFYVNNDALDPTDPWPVGAPGVGENESITTLDEPVAEGDQVRIRMSLQVSNANLPAGLRTFKLQYGVRTGSCSAIETWTDVGATTSSAIWRGYNTSVANGTALSTDPPGVDALNLSVSDVAGRFAEDLPTVANPFDVNDGEDVEYDFVIEHNGALGSTFYCFRVVQADDTPIDGYINYPQLRTAGFTPLTENWRWYSDEENETPSTPAANENAAPIDVGFTEGVALRISVDEIKNVDGNNAKFKLQFSEDATFSTVSDVVATSTCTASSTWCYIDGGGVDNALISSSTLSDADSCVASVGNGCGRHNASADLAAGHTHPGGAISEYSFTIQHAGARAGAVYYFRLYDVTNDAPVLASTSYPSLVTASAELIFTTTGLPVGTTTEGITTDVATASTSITFGDLPFGTDYKAAYRLSVNTNATEGYQVFMRADRDLENVYGETLPANTGSNAVPSAWSTGCTGLPACFAYHAGDDSLSGGSARFAPDDSYAALSSTTLEEVAYSSVPVNESHDIVFRAVATEAQPAGEYSTDLMFIVVPVY